LGSRPFGQIYLTQTRQDAKISYPINPACPVEFLPRLPYEMMLKFYSIGVKSQRAISLGHAAGGTIQLG